VTKYEFFTNHTHTPSCFRHKVTWRYHGTPLLFDEEKRKAINQVTTLKSLIHVGRDSWSWSGQRCFKPWLYFEQT